LLIAAAGSAQPADHRTYFTFSGPVELPGVALAPGKCLFRIANPESSGNVVQVLSADGTKSYAMFFALPVLRTQPSPDPSVQFMETPTGTPLAIRAWWDAGAVLGREFLYPKSRRAASPRRRIGDDSTTGVRRPVPFGGVRRPEPPRPADLAAL
jgi:hypothetical protein